MLKPRWHEVRFPWSLAPSEKLFPSVATYTPAAAIPILYDADGNRLIQRDPGGTTAYLPGGTELRLDSGTSSPHCTRYYTHLGATIAVRTATSLSWVAADLHNTASIHIDNATGAVTRRYSDPFGNPRGSTPIGWAGTRGFVDGIRDATGLTHLGAREYDPNLGRFVSVDPVFETADPQQLGGYSYAANDPVNVSDSTGLCPRDRCGGYGQNPHAREGSGSGGSGGGGGGNDGGCTYHSASCDGYNGGGPGSGVAKSNDAPNAGNSSGAPPIMGWNPVTKAIGRKVWQGSRFVVNMAVSSVVLNVAQRGGASCSMNGQEIMIVCKDAPMWMYNRAGTTVGSVFLTGDIDKPSPRTMTHEAKHADQWAIAGLVLGPVGFIAFPVSYGVAEYVSGGGSCNIYEQWAGLSDGGYAAC